MAAQSFDRHVPHPQAAADDGDLIDVSRFGVLDHTGFGDGAFGKERMAQRRGLVRVLQRDAFLHFPFQTVRKLLST